ncbi:mCG147056 [Mus musculus]|nr:mCG147056 [Mus musculus]
MGQEKPDLPPISGGEMSENGCLLDNEIPHQNGELWSGIHQVGSVVL